MQKGFTRNFPPLKVLTEEQVEAIHRATLAVLRETGVRFESKKALEILEKNGCIVDHDEMRVRFPEAVIEECIRRCPSTFRLKARHPSRDIVVGGNSVYFMSAPGMQTVDSDTWEPRDATRKEYYDYLKILDALPHLHYFSSYPLFGFQGVPTAMKIVEGAAAKIRSSAMWQFDSNAMEADVWIIQLSQAVGADIGSVMCAAAPLTYFDDQVEVALRGTEAGITMSVISGCVYGGSGPATIAGSVVTDNAEVLAGVALIQLVKPGTRIWTMDQTNPQNMRTGSPQFDNIASALHMAAGTQLWRKYEIPHKFACAGYTNSKIPDIQSGYERSMNALIQVLAGASLIGLFGGVYGEVSAHPLVAIIDDDIAGMIGRFIESIEVNDETLAVDLINEVGPIPGHYLNKAHTRKWWEKEQFIPKAADYLTYPEWIKTGKKSAIDYAKEKMEEILATHKVAVPLTPSQEEDIERILNEARKYYRDKGQITDEEWAAMKKDIGSPNYPYG